jgi:alkylated DNA nucleotide flippase Atl1
MPSVRAEEVAEILWELKRADKVATYSLIADRAGFSAGSNGRAMATCLRTVRRDWPHLQWWRAIRDDGVLENGEQESHLRELGLEPQSSKENGNALIVNELEEFLMDWNSNGDGQSDASVGEAGTSQT